MALHVRHLGDQTSDWTDLELAREEARQIRGLSGWRKLRVKVSGDSRTRKAAGIIGSAMVAHERKHKRHAWTYTHTEHPLAAWNGARVLASCETPAKVRRMTKAGYACVLIVPPHPTHKVYKYKGLKVIPCPAQFKHTTCERCSVCADTKRLRRRKLVVGFEPDYQTDKKVIPLLPKR
jgi:hypothetical protein